MLVIEGEEPLAQALRSGLEREGFSVEVAHDGPTGLSLATETNPDAIVVDAVLPGLDGLEMSAALRKADNWTPVLVLTAEDGGLHAAGLDAGADDSLSKPVSAVVLVARLRALLQRGGHRVRPTRLTAGGLVIDPTAHLCWRNDIPIELTPREFALLEFLVRRKGEVLSKKEILEHVWHPDYDGDGNIVEVYLHHLRQKIDEPFRRNAIQTIRSEGYRLAADGG